jgi:putative endonuclease
MPPRFFTYMLTNKHKRVLYTGMTNNLAERLIGHYITEPGHFSADYRVWYLLWFDETKYVRNAIECEKEIKRYSRAQKEALINASNPEWRFLNEDVVGNWPPTEEQIASVRDKWQRNSERWW